MNNCHYIEQIDTYLFDRETLSQADTFALTSHLETCTDCQQAYQYLLEIQKYASTTPLRVPDAAFFQRLPYQIAYTRTKSTPSLKRMVLRPLITFAVFAIIFWGAYFTWWNSSEKDTLDQLYWETFSLEKSMQISYTVEEESEYTLLETNFAITQVDEIDDTDLDLLEKNIKQFRIINPRQE